jgi:hypothetical protein
MSDYDTPPGDLGGSGSSVPPPPPPSPPGPAIPPARSGGSIVLGLVIGLGSMLAGGGLVWVLSGGQSVPQVISDLLGAIAGVLPFALIVLGIVLSALPKTRRTGAGILLSFGIAVLIAGGLCVALLAGVNTIP